MKPIYIILQNILFNLQSQLILYNPVDANSEKLCETESVSTGVMQHGQRYIYGFLWKTSLSSIGETNMHLTNTFKDELTSSLKQYSLMNSLKLQFLCFLYISCGCTPFFSITGTLTNSKGLDEMAHNAIFYQGLHCLQ